MIVAGERVGLPVTRSRPQRVRISADAVNRRNEQRQIVTPRLVAPLLLVAMLLLAIDASLISRAAFATATQIWLVTILTVGVTVAALIRAIATNQIHSRALTQLQRIARRALAG